MTEIKEKVSSEISAKSFVLLTKLLITKKKRRRPVTVGVFLFFFLLFFYSSLLLFILPLLSYSAKKQSEGNLGLIFCKFDCFFIVTNQRKQEYNYSIIIATVTSSEILNTTATAFVISGATTTPTTNSTTSKVGSLSRPRRRQRERHTDITKQKF